MAEAKVLLEFDLPRGLHRLVETSLLGAIQYRDGMGRWTCYRNSAQQEIALAVYREMAARLSQAERERDEEERACLEVMAERDRAVEAADALAYASGEVGEHSNMNCPWANGLECIAELHEKVKQAERELTEARGILSRIGNYEATCVAARAVDAPCVLCGYNGPSYWQAGSHKEGCAVRDIGGFDDRHRYFASRIRTAPPVAATQEDGQ